ncbi:gephyrin-like molybdotransferase Glp [Schaalia sp. ZJ1691]|uniref:molybdopterin molybdotransferase MoeA n=1 Tax=Schaalia sp. ZJ1691 TaxID=2709404 RepID=UPI0013EC8FFD|nr:gephyrin-like molybdotransferase Glp [Schaalia sp. ZJ1691]
MTATASPDHLRNDAHATSRSPEEYRAFLESLVGECRIEPLSVSDPRILGRVLAQPLHSRIDVPPFENSAMDGFAVRHADIHGPTPVALDVDDDLPAGDTRRLTLHPGRAIRVMTGGQVPREADTVVPVEYTDHQPGVRQAPKTVTIGAHTISLGANIRRRGEDMQTGDPVLAAGTALDAARLSAAVATGHRIVNVHAPARIAIFSTGSELVSSGDQRNDGQIPDSNSVLLASLVREAGGEVVAVHRTKDNPEDFLSLLSQLPDVDLVLTTGGISAGAYEVVRQALSDRGVTFTHVLQQPGGPQGAGRATLGTPRTPIPTKRSSVLSKNGSDQREIPCVCLPGNPVSVFATFHFYVFGLISMMSGQTTTSRRPTVTVRAGHAWASPPGKLQLCPVVVENDDDGDELTVRLTHPLGVKSHLVASLALCDGLAIVGRDVQRVQEGDCLEFLWTRTDRQ